MVFFGSLSLFSIMALDCSNCDIVFSFLVCLFSLSCSSKMILSISCSSFMIYSDSFCSLNDDTIVSVLIPLTLKLSNYNSSKKYFYNFLRDNSALNSSHIITLFVYYTSYFARSRNICSYSSSMTSYSGCSLAR